MERFKSFILLIAIFSLPITAQETTYTNQVLAPGWTKLSFEAPQPASYTLARYQSASNGAVVDSNGTSLDLHEIFDDKVVLLNFMYSTCTDVNGCPLATAVFHKVKNLLDKDPEIGKQVSITNCRKNVGKR